MGRPIVEVDKADRNFSRREASIQYMQVVTTSNYTLLDKRAVSDARAKSACGEKRTLTGILR